MFKPLIPKVRVGEILHGTRNLRNYLKYAGWVYLLSYNELSLIRSSATGLKKLIAERTYFPRKDDEFVVLANSSYSFCVWGKNKDTFIFFINPHEKYKRLKPNEEIRMSPQIFSTWFTKTNSFNLKTNEWPLAASYVRSALHLEARLNKETHLPFQVSTNQCRIPKEIFEHLKITPPEYVKQSRNKLALYESIKEGNFRRGLFRSTHPTEGKAAGLLYSDIESMKKSIDSIMKRIENKQKAVTKELEDHLNESFPF